MFSQATIKQAFFNPTTISVLVLLREQEAVLFLNEGQVNRDGKSYLGICLPSSMIYYPITVWYGQ